MMRMALLSAIGGGILLFVIAIIIDGEGDGGFDGVGVVRLLLFILPPILFPMLPPPTPTLMIGVILPEEAEEPLPNTPILTPLVLLVGVR